jgi:hypothetical protein
LRVPIAMRRFYEQTLWIPQNFPPTNPDLHHGLLKFPSLWVNALELPNHVFRSLDSDVQAGLACIQHDADCLSHQPR